MQTILPNTIVAKDPSDEEFYSFDWTDYLTPLGASVVIQTSEWTIAGPDAALVKEHEGLLTGSRKTVARLKAGTLSGRYTVSNKIITNEALPRTKERSFIIWITNL